MAEGLFSFQDLAKRLLAVHCASGGEKTVSLPEVYRQVVDVLGGTVIAQNTAAFTYPFKSPDTVLFELTK